MGFPDWELLDTTLFLTVLFRNFQADISSLREYIKDLQADISALREFVTVGKAGFSALQGDRVNVLCQQKVKAESSRWTKILQHLLESALEATKP